MIVKDGYVTLFEAKESMVVTDEMINKAFESLKDSEEKTQLLAIYLETPKSCSACAFYSRKTYRCHNESGIESHCALGFMRNNDMRDRVFENKIFEGCKLSKYFKKLQTGANEE